MIQRAILIAFAWVLLSAQSPIPGFPPGLFTNRAAVGGAAGYTGPGDIVSGAKVFWGLRGYNAAYSGNAANICTPLDVLCLDVTIDPSTGGLNTTTLGTLACNNTTTICTVKTLYDQSGALSCGGAACPLTQATSANRPLYRVTCFGTLPCLSFGGGGATLVNATGIGALAQPLSISGIFNRQSVVNFDCYLCDSTGSGLLANNGANAVLMFIGGGLTTATANDTASHTGQFIYNGASSFYYIDGTNTANAGLGATGLAAGSISMGANGVRNAVTAFIGEFGVWGSAFSVGNSSSMCHNQFAYWGTSTSC